MALMTMRAMPVARVRSTVARVSEAGRRATTGARRPRWTGVDAPIGRTARSSPYAYTGPRDRTHRARRGRARPQPRRRAPVGGRPAAAGDRSAGVVDRRVPGRDPAHGDRRFGVRDRSRGPP